MQAICTASAAYRACQAPLDGRTPGVWVAGSAYTAVTLYISCNEDTSSPQYRLSSHSSLVIPRLSARTREPKMPNPACKLWVGLPHPASRQQYAMRLPCNYRSCQTPFLGLERESGMLIRSNPKLPCTPLRMRLETGVWDAIRPNCPVSALHMRSGFVSIPALDLLPRVTAHTLVPKIHCPSIFGVWLVPSL